MAKSVVTIHAKDLPGVKELIGELVSIVRAVDEEEPAYWDHRGDGYYCAMCDVPITTRTPQSHDESCPWRRAVEWVAAHGGTDG